MVVQVRKIGDEYFAFIVDCEDPKACTVLLRGASKDILNEVERNLQVHYNGCHCIQKILQVHHYRNDCHCVERILQVHYHHDNDCHGTVVYHRLNCGLQQHWN